MRDIRYRAWDRSNKRMWQVAALHFAKREVMYRHQNVNGGPVAGFDECEVIGNVYENPELLEKAK